MSALKRYSVLVFLFWVAVFAVLLYERSLDVTPCAAGDLVCQEDQ